MLRGDPRGHKELWYCRMTYHAWSSPKEKKKNKKGEDDGDDEGSKATSKLKEAHGWNGGLV